MRREVGNQFFSHTFLKICILNLVMMIYCCTTILVYKLCIRNKTRCPLHEQCKSVSPCSHSHTSQITMASSPCQPFLNIRLSTPHSTTTPPPPTRTCAHTNTHTQHRASSFPLLLYLHMTF